MTRHPKTGRAAPKGRAPVTGHKAASFKLPGKSAANAKFNRATGKPTVKSAIKPQVAAALEQSNSKTY